MLTKEFREKEQELQKKLRESNKNKFDVEIPEFEKPKQKPKYNNWKYKKKPAMLEYIEAQERRESF